MQDQIDRPEDRLQERRHRLEGEKGNELIQDRGDREKEEHVPESEADEREVEDRQRPQPTRRWLLLGRLLANPLRQATIGFAVEIADQVTNDVNDGETPTEDTFSGTLDARGDSEKNGDDLHTVGDLVDVEAVERVRSPHPRELAVRTIEDEAQLNDEPGDQRRWIRADRVQRAVQ